MGQIIRRNSPDDSLSVAENRKNKIAKKKKAKLDLDNPPVRVKIVHCNSSTGDDFAPLEKVLSLAASFPDRYEILSEDKTITPGGNFVYVITYKETEPIEVAEDADELEITIETDDF